MQFCNEVLVSVMALLYCRQKRLDEDDWPQPKTMTVGDNGARENDVRHEHGFPGTGMCF
jgi:hypothetical protein